MKKLLTRLTAALLVCITALTVVPESELQVQAATPRVDKKIEAILYPDYTGHFKIDIYNYDYSLKNRTITDIKVENEDIVEVRKSKIPLYFPKQEGTTKVSFKFAGKKLSTTIEVKKWENPCRKFVLGTKDLKKNFDKSGIFTQVTDSKKGKTKKFKVEAADGWKIAGIYCLDDTNWKKIKNNSKISMNPSKGKGQKIGVIFQNKTTKKKELLYYEYDYVGKSYKSDNNYNTYRDRIDIQILIKDITVRKKSA